MDRGFRDRPRQIGAGASSDQDSAISFAAICRRACHDLGRALPDIVLFELVFQALAFLILSPLAAWLFARFVATSGKSAVGNFDIVRFLLTPMGLLLGLAILTLSIALGSANSAGLFYIAYGAGLDRRVTYFEALRFVAIRSGRLLAASFLTLLLLAATALPFVAAAGFVAWKLLTEHDINYYLAEHPPEFKKAIIAGCILGALAAVAVAFVAGSLIFLLPEAMLGGDPLRSTALRSFRLARRNRWRILILLIGWLLAWELTSLLVNGGLYLLGRTLVRAAGDHLALLLTTLGIVMAANFVLNFAIALLAVASGGALLAQLYLRVCRRQSIAPSMLSSLPMLESKPRWSVPRKAPLAVSLLAMILATMVVYALLKPVQWDDHVEISAHRGASYAKPENTVSAVRQAIEDGATYVEIDVQLTRDGQVVVVHDADMMRLARSPLVVNRSTYDEVRALSFSGEQVPTLDEVIKLTRGKAKLIVELKTYGSDPVPLIDAVIQKLRTQDMLGQAVVMSLEYNEALETMRREPRLPVGFVTSATLGDLSKLDVDFLAVSRSQATNTFIAAAHAQGKQIYVWTIDDQSGMTTMIDRGVDNIITNNPSRLIEVLRERRNLEPAERLLLRFRSLYLD